MEIFSARVIWLRSLSTLAFPVTTGVGAAVCANATLATKNKAMSPRDMYLLAVIPRPIL
jgi:hypothetical protein